MEQTKSKYQKIVDIIALVIASGLCIFQLYSASFGTWSSFVLSAVHWGVIGSYIILRNPTKLKGAGPVIDWLMIAATVFICIYQIQMQERMVMSAGFYTNMDVVVGIVAILLVLEIGRRSVGKILPIICILFLGYCYFGHYVPGLLKTARFAVKRIAVFIYTSSDGLFGQTLYVSAKYIFLFILFGSILELTGAGKWFVDLAYAAVGKSRGGPAQAAVYSSMLMGTINGSGAANVVTTGTFTIPLMKKIGLKPSTAGAVEAVASSGGQIMPPVMGAAAFIMTEYIGCSYGTIALAACIPALLYFTGIFTNVHFEALKRGLLGLPKEQRPVAKQLIKDGWYMILPVIVIVALLCTGSSAMKAAIWGIISCLFIWIINIVREEKKFDAAKFAKMFVQGLADSAQSAISVAITCGCAGIIVGVVTMTGLGLKMANGLVAMAGGSLWLTMIFTMLCSIVLGMGVPTTANYIIQATISAPALVALGVPKLAAHMFVFYFGIVADITPPVALAAFAGSGIAGSNPMKTGFTATRLGIAAYIVPYMFVLNPILVLVNVNNLSTGVFVLMAIKAVVTAFIGMVGLASGSSGFFKAPCNLLERIVLIASGLLLIDPGTLTDIAGIGIILLIYFIQKAREKRTAVTG